MRPEKQSLTKEYVARLNASPFFIVVEYKGLKVSQITELRKRLNMSLVKNFSRPISRVCRSEDAGILFFGT